MSTPKPSASGSGGAAPRTRGMAPRLGAAALAMGVSAALTGCGSEPSGHPAPPARTTTGSAVSGQPARTTGGIRTLADPAPSCANRALAAMSQRQRVGQLFMVGISAAGISQAQLNALRRADVGAVQLTGRSTAGTARIRALTNRLQTLSLSVRGARARLLTAADQEGGLVQALRGPGFAAIPSAVVQGRSTAGRLQSQAAGWARQLRAAGVNTNLAPVADTVPVTMGTANAPIGALSREYGHTPGTVSTHSTAFLRGMSQGGVLATLKHFPGLGRVRGNTDLRAGVTDTVTTRHDSYLAPFRSGVRAGAPFVMASLAIYSRVDARNPAAFSPVVLRGMLRGDLGFNGVIISDDLGNAAAVRSVPAGQRALRFLTAGGDLVLTDNPATVAPMTSAVLARLNSSAALRTTVATAARRVLAAKQRLGLLTCG